MPLTPGARLGAYEIASSLGAGGMGEVYCARDAKLGRDVAIKVLPDALVADPVSRARLKREAQAVAALSHPNILGIFDFGVARYSVCRPGTARRQDAVRAAEREPAGREGD